jgi:hypothetical protein
MTEAPGLEAAIRALQELRARERPPDHRDARALLVELGLRLLGAPEGATDLEHARRATEALGEAWLTAAREELALAATEYVRSVDPRFLELPNYDFEYTLAARERLEARLVAAKALGLAPGTRTLRKVERADALLAKRLEALERPPRGREGGFRDK